MPLRRAPVAPTRCQPRQTRCRCSPAPSSAAPAASACKGAPSSNAVNRFTWPPTLAQTGWVSCRLEQSSPKQGPRPTTNQQRLPTVPLTQPTARASSVTHANWMVSCSTPQSWIVGSKRCTSPTQLDRTAGRQARQGVSDPAAVVLSLRAPAAFSTRASGRPPIRIKPQVSRSLEGVGGMLTWEGQGPVQRHPVVANGRHPAAVGWMWGGRLKATPLATWTV